MISRRAFGIGVMAVTGDGLVRPLNAPRGVAATPGVQPGTSGLTLARYVIVYGPGSGIFVYAGTPALGNLIASISSAAGTDRYGNTYPGGIFGELTTNLILFTSGAELQSASSGTGVVLNNGPLQSTAGTAADPTLITTDTWHSLGSAGATNCTLIQARYRLTAGGECEIDIALVALAGGSTAGTYTWSNTLPAAYQFAGDSLRIYPFPFNSNIITATQDSIIAVDGSGTGSPGRVRITIPAVAAGVYFTGTCFVPLT
jgi:hypothetical protein